MSHTIELNESAGPTTTASVSSGRTAAAPPVISVWAAMRADGDPLALAAGEDTALSFELVYTSPAAAERDVLLRVLVQGRFRATQGAVTLGGAERISGFFQGTFTLQTHLGTEDSNESTSIGLGATIARTGTASAGTVNAVFDAGDSLHHFIARAQWDGQKVTADLSLVGREPTPTAGVNDQLHLLSVSSVAATIPLLSAVATVSADALSTGSALRALSTSALDAVGAEMERLKLGGPDYEDAALKLLFPVQPAGDVIVRPTLDWVLFQRRRTKRCSIVPEKPVTPTTRRFWLYDIKVPNDPKILQAVIQSLSTPQAKPTQRYPTNLAGVVEYDGGLTSMATDPTLLLADWTRLNPGNVLAYAAIATSNAGDESLERGRLSTAVSAVASLTPASSSTALDTLAAAPAAVPIPTGADGIMVFVTTQRVSLQCADVYGVMDEGAARVESPLKNRVMTPAVLAQFSTSLGKVQFESGTASADEPSLASLQTNWNTLGGGMPLRSYILSKSGDAQASTYLSQARVILLRVAGQTLPDPIAVAIDSWPFTCPSVTLIFGTVLR
jgi:hypothetical protein